MKFFHPLYKPTVLEVVIETANRPLIFEMRDEYLRLHIGGEIPIVGTLANLLTGKHQYHVRRCGHLGINTSEQLTEHLIGLNTSRR